MLFLSWARFAADPSVSLDSPTHATPRYPSAMAPCAPKMRLVAALFAPALFSPHINPATPRVTASACSLRHGASEPSSRDPYGSDASSHVDHGCTPPRVRGELGAPVVARGQLVAPSGLRGSPGVAHAVPGMHDEQRSGPAGAPVLGDEPPFELHERARVPARPALVLRRSTRPVPVPGQWRAHLVESEVDAQLWCIAVRPVADPSIGGRRVVQLVVPTAARAYRPHPAEVERGNGLVDEVADHLSSGLGEDPVTHVGPNASGPRSAGLVDEARHQRLHRWRRVLDGDLEDDAGRGRRVVDLTLETAHLVRVQRTARRSLQPIPACLDDHVVATGVDPTGRTIERYERHRESGATRTGWNRGCLRMVRERAEDHDESEQGGDQSHLAAHGGTAVPRGHFRSKTYGEPGDFVSSTDSALRLRSWAKAR